MGAIVVEKFLCDLKDHRQHGLTYFNIIGDELLLNFGAKFQR